MKPAASGVAMLLSLWLVHATEAAERPVVSIAHRGGIVPGVPENTLAAFRRAIQEGAHVIEIDLRATKDGEVVVMHDDTVDRTTNGRGKVAELLWPELKNMDAGGGQRVPTYEEVLQLVAGTGVALLLDIKESSNLDKRKVVRLTEKHDAVNNVIVGPRRLADLRAFQALNANLKTLGFVKEVDDVQAFVDAGVDLIRLWPEWIARDPGLIDRLHRLGKPVWVTADDAPREKLAQLIKLGVDGILSDFPEQMRSLLAGAAQP
jgi:glycerophosphoryl diester phosphodiesterase